MASRPTSRTAIVAMTVLVLLAVAGFAVGTFAGRGSSTEAAPLTAAQVTEELFELTNADRADAGLAPLSRHAGLDDFAEQWAESLSDAGELTHRSQLGRATADHIGGDGWATTGENVGVGATPESLAAAFLESPEHRVNVLDPAFTDAGVGVVVDDAGVLWVAVNFIG